MTRMVAKLVVKSEGCAEICKDFVAQSRLSSIQSVRCGGSSSKEGEVVDQIKVGEARWMVPRTPVAQNQDKRAKRMVLLSPRSA